MGQGTTRLIDDVAVGGRVRQLGDEITDVRRRLDALVMELDRRRHNMTDWRRQLRLHAREIAVGVLVVAVAVTAPVALARVRARRRSSLLGRGGELREKARRFGQAFERITEDPDRLAPNGRPGVEPRSRWRRWWRRSGHDDSPCRVKQRER
jgi:hypothetical protein